MQTDSRFAFYTQHDIEDKLQISVSKFTYTFHNATSHSYHTAQVLSPPLYICRIKSAARMATNYKDQDQAQS